MRFYFIEDFFIIKNKNHGIRVYTYNAMKYYSNNNIDTILNRYANTKFLFHYLYIITYIRSYKFKNRTYSKDDYVPLNIDTLRKIINYDNAHKFLKELIDLKIITCNEEFSRVNHKSKGYKLNYKVLTDKFYLRKDTDKKLDIRIEKAYEKLKMKLIFDDELGYGYVTECMEHLNINSKDALNSIKTLTGEPKEFAKMAIEKFSDKFFKKDRTANRLHNNLTNLYTPLRHFLSYKGQKLVQCDIRNSQLVFLYILMKDCYIPEQEMEKFKAVVCDYGFYEFFAEKIGIELTEEKRKEFKQVIFEKLLFGTNKTDLSEMEKMFKQEFPTIFYIIRSIKTDDYKSLAIMLQKKESEFIFDCVRKVNKKAPIFTIHDSLATTIGNETLIYKIMTDEFKNKFNLSPKINIEKF